MKIITLRPASLIWGVLLSVCCAQLSASQLVYVPTNPSFGGNPNNGAYLLNNAQSQNNHTADNDFGITEQSDLERFTNTLQTQLLNDILGSATSGTDAINQTLTTGSFVVNLNREQGGSTLTVSIRDTATGQTSIIKLEQ